MTHTVPRNQDGICRCYKLFCLLFSFNVLSSCEMVGFLFPTPTSSYILLLQCIFSNLRRWCGNFHCVALSSTHMLWNHIVTFRLQFCSQNWVYSSECTSFSYLYNSLKKDSIVIVDSCNCNDYMFTVKSRYVQINLRHAVIICMKDTR